MSDSPVPHPQTTAELSARLSTERLGVPFLLFRDGDQTLQFTTLPAERERLTLGRDAGNDLALTWDGEVSRAHAELERVGGEWAVSDQGLSRNGTFVNGQLVTGRRRLRSGDVLRVGRTLMVFTAPVSGGAGVTIQAAVSSPVDDLTTMQRRILAALCRPLITDGDAAVPASNQAIADEVHLSVQGVKSQLRTLSERFGCDDLPQNRKRLALAERAVRAGFGGAATP